ncbi:hypothetical protein PFISCL1PPCAC_1484, partial [Pristionchus fissidentatus]
SEFTLHIVPEGGMGSTGVFTHLGNPSASEQYSSSLHFIFSQVISGIGSIFAAEHVIPCCPLIQAILGGQSELTLHMGPE